MIELTLLKAMSDRKVFDSYRHLLNPKSLSVQSKQLLKDYEVYFSLNIDTQMINMSVFNTFFFNERNPYLDDKSVLEYRDILEQIDKADIPADISRLIRSFEQQEFYRDLSIKLESNVDINTVRDDCEQFITRTSGLIPNGMINPFKKMDLKEALTYTDRSKGLLWRCKALREHFNGGLKAGDFGIIAGYVDSGKSSFIGSELSYMGQQLEGDDYLLWLTNEGDHKDYLPRLHQATLGKTDAEIRKHEDKAIKLYKQAMKDKEDRIIIHDIQGYSTKDIERLLKYKIPRLLVIDLLDHVSGFNNFNSKESGSFEIYNKLYQWAREVATCYQTIVLGVSQMNADGENATYPPMSKLRGSKVDKQAACTFQIMIGSMAGSNVRYLSMPKNKINSNKNWRTQVNFDPERSRFS